MAGSLINKYIWLIDLIKRRGRITREEVNRAWINSSFSRGEEMSRRTFLNYRNGAEEMFKVTIGYDASTYEYYIDESHSQESEARVRDWLLDSMALNGMMRDSQDIANLIMVENVPSAREHLPVIVDSLRQGKRVEFLYQSYDRIQAHKVVLEPYFLRIFKQLWYVIGLDTKDNKIKTYALDRMSKLHITDVDYAIPEGFSGEQYFANSFGITTSQGEAKNITLRVKPKQAKYFRALPLHHSQTEEVHEQYSLFHYKMYITYDLTQQLLSYGPEIEVIEPRELKVTIIEKLKSTLEQYK